jgi:tetratricopeptide (TPR) repeat protein
MVTPFAALAFALLLLEAVAPTGGAGAVRTPGSNGRAAGARRPRLRIPGRPVVAAGLGALAVLIGLGAGGAGDPLARIDTLEQAANRRALRPWELIELGVARYEAGRRDEARHALGAAAHAALEANRSDQAAIAYHDLGVLDLDGDDLEAARDHFLEAVALAPGDHRSRFNLEWTLRALEQPEDEPPPSPTGEPPLDEDDPARTPERPETPEASPLPAPGKRLPPQPTPAERSTADSETSPGNAAGGVIDDPARAMLDVERAERWLARVSDDTGRALRSAAEPDGRPRAARDRGPAW